MPDAESRFQDALFIQGACNPAGVASALARAIEQFMKTPAYGGTASICQDPALRLMAHQLAYLFHLIPSTPDYPLIYDQCAAIAAALGEPAAQGGVQ